MKFVVRFKTPGNPGYIIIQDRALGLRWLDKVREFYSLPELDCSLIVGDSPIYRDSVNVPLTVEEARESGHFEEGTFATVVANAENVLRHVSLEPKAEKDPQTGEILSVGSYHYISHADIISAWREAGFPLIWE